MLASLLINYNSNLFVIDVKETPRRISDPAIEKEVQLLTMIEPMRPTNEMYSIEDGKLFEDT